MNANKVHHLNCGSMRLRFGKEFDGHRGWFDDTLEIVNHCLLIETAASGLVVVDTGYGTYHVTHPESVPLISRFVTRPTFDMEETILAHVERLGFRRHDVRHIVFTHLDHDHMGGLGDFPIALAHVLKPEWDEAMTGHGRKHSLRYRPDELKAHLCWQFYPADEGDTWFGLPAVRPIRELEDTVALVPLLGHSAGHCGVAVYTGDGWLLYAGDAYMVADEMISPPYGDESTGVFTRMIQHDEVWRQDSLNTLRALRVTHPREVTIFCAHDKEEFEQFVGEPVAA